MKVLMVSPLPPPYGGIAHWTELIVEHAGRRGASDVEIDVVDTAPRKRGGLEVHRLSRVWEGVGRMGRDNARLVRRVRQFQPDVVHLNTSGQLAFVRDAVIAFLLGRFRVPFVYHLRFGRLASIIEHNTIEWKVAKLALRRAAAVIALDLGTEEALRHARIARRVVRVPNPIPDERLLPADVDPVREDVVLFVGWVIPAKGVQELLAAWESVETRGWRLEIAGPADDDYLRALRGRGLPDGVEILGSLGNKEVLDRMRRSKVFVLPSHTEGFPNAVLEAMASGAAVVSTSVGAIPDMLSDGAGIVVPPKQVDRLAMALASLIDDAELSRHLGRRALATARSRFALSQVFQRYTDVWRTAAAGALRR